MSSESSGSSVPRFTIVSAVYNVAPYLDDFIDSLEKQTFGLERVQIVMVDDGSTDDSQAILERWRDRRPELVTVISKPNGGQASARNLGLEHARGEWITFTDPDDKLEPDALAEVDKFLEKFPATQLVALSRIMYYEKTDKFGAHPLSRHFTERNVLRNLDEHPEFFFGSAPAGFFRRSVIEQEGLRFSELIKPNFEDGFFCNSYLLRVPKPLVGFVTTAKYVYRKRGDNSSTLNLSRLNVGRYTAVVQHGFLGLLEEAMRIRGEVPGFIQTHILYELSYYFKDEEAEFGLQTAAVGPVAEEIHEHLARISRLLDPWVIRGFRGRPMRPIVRETLLHGYRDEPWHAPYVVIDRYDHVQQTVRVIYRFTHTLPDEQFLLFGVPVEPLHQKICAPSYFERSLVKERIVWLPVGTLRVRLDGVECEVRTDEPEPPALSLGTTRIRRALDPRVAAAHRRKLAQAEHRSLGDRAITRLSRTKVVRRFFHNAWVLMDRIYDADDSGEHLFRYLRKHEPKINAWFVIERGTPDWRRLRKDGHRRLVPHGGLLWKLLMLNCAQLISSHADLAVNRPPKITKLADPRWRFTFLQHGVLKDDLSRWLNPKQIDVFVVSTRAEYESIAGDGTGYRYTTREVQLTGLPRFDRVLEAGLKYPPHRRDLLLITPTWRNWLVRPKERGSQRWTIELDEFRASDFAQNWRGVVLDERLQALAKREGLQIALLMHPNLQAVAPALDLPPEIKTYTFGGSDVRELFARARVLVTDYSSMAFNAAYIDRPIVYFHFDAERMFGGGHVGRGGYFKYERDGFGPVAYTVEDAVAAIAATVEAGPDPLPEYGKRIEEAFPARDGRCSERVVAAINQSSAKARRPLRSVDAPTDQERDNAVAIEATEIETLAREHAVDDVIADAGHPDGPDTGPDPAGDVEPVVPLGNESRN